MRFSILVPVYNVEKYVKESIESILGQTFCDFELILVDDGSKDSSGLICDEYLYDGRVKVFHQNNQGLISARRVGLKLAKGEYILFCDSDDLLEKDALMILNSVIERTDPDIVLYNLYVFGKNRKVFFEHLFPDMSFVDKKDILNELFVNYKFNSLCNKVCKKDLFDIDVDYSSFYSDNYGEDLLQSTPVYINANRIIYLDKALYNYRYSSGMMRKFNSNYYSSYKHVSRQVEKLLSNANLKDSVKKKDIYILNAVYGHIMQYKFLESINSNELRDLSVDEDFVNAYDNVYKNSSLGENYISKKQKMILSYLRSKNIFMLNFMLKMTKFKFMFLRK